MAELREVRLIDDLDGQSADETVTFGLDGKTLEIDLSTENATKLRDIMAPYVAAARKAGAGHGRAPKGFGPPRAVGRSDMKDMRDWLRANGYPVKDKGRIPSDYEAAYDARRPAQEAQTSPKGQETSEVGSEVPTAIEAPVFSHAETDDAPVTEGKRKPRRRSA